MHILHVISSLDPAMGGPAEGVRLLLSVESGWTGEAVTFDDPQASFLQQLPFTVHALGPVGSTYGWNRRFYRWLRANRGRFDGILVNGLWQYCGPATMLGSRGGPPYMVWTHGMLDPYFKRRDRLKHLLKALYWYPVEFWVLKKARRVLFTTDTERDLAKRSFALSAWKDAVVPYGVKGPELSQEECRRAFEAAVPALKGQRFLVFLGRIDPKKGCDLLVNAFCQSGVEDPGLHLLMAGPSDGWASRLKERVEAAGLSERVHWPGILLGPAKWGAFLAAEAFILPSHQENFGIAVAEALSCGRPVLLSDQVNIGSLIGDAGCALIEPDTLEGTRNLMRRWIDLSQRQRSAMSDAASECFRTRLNLQRSVALLQSLFTEANAEKRDTDRR